MEDDDIFIKDQEVYVSLDLRAEDEATRMNLRIMLKMHMRRNFLSMTMLKMSQGLPLTRKTQRLERVRSSHLWLILGWL